MRRFESSGRGDETRRRERALFGTLDRRANEHGNRLVGPTGCRKRFAENETRPGTQRRRKAFDRRAAACNFVRDKASASNAPPLGFRQECDSCIAVGRQAFERGVRVGGFGRR
ncbi:MAG: hypothetical protein DCC68_17910 [Planctomycetota bacterium]|nr:MAG: hypothetical protein DCC68_17910 [Planctomycetota bacterium]